MANDTTKNTASDMRESLTGPAAGIDTTDQENRDQTASRREIAPESSAARGETGRDLKPALWKGWRRKCPNCGSGPLLSGYLKVRDHCPVCREDLHHHRADDGPAYLTILIVGHLMAPALHVSFTTFRPDPLILFTIFAIGCIGLSLYLLPRLKGMVVAFQWARGMHGFAPST